MILTNQFIVLATQNHYQKKKKDQIFETTPVCFYHGNSVQYNNDTLQTFLIAKRIQEFLCNYTFPMDLPPKLPKYPKIFPRYNTHKTGKWKPE